MAEDTALREQLEDARERIAQLERTCAALTLVLQHVTTGVVDVKLQDAMREGNQVRPVFHMAGPVVAVDFVVRFDLPKVTPPTNNDARVGLAGESEQEK